MITPVNVPVPISGDGPAVDVSALVGPKTVQLSGTYEGYYDLLGSQDGQTFVPVASFNADGPEGIKQTIPGAFSSVRLRSGAVAAVGVVCEVSGVAGAGQNGFGVIATLGGGFTGLTPPVDTSTFIPPTGSEEDTCFLCRGSFTGPITVLGSSDGVEFNPLGAWNPGRLPQGAPPIVELAPLTTKAKVRYVRLLVSGVVTGVVTVTMGGRVPSSGSAGKNLSIVTSSALNAGFYFAGPQATGPIFTDALDNVVNYTGSGAYGSSDIVCVGSVNKLIASEGVIVAVGYNNVAYGGDLFVIGDSCGIAPASGVVTTNYAYNCILIGADVLITGSGTQFNTMIGNSLTANGDNSSNNTIMGASIDVGTTSGSQYNVAIGSNFSIGDDAFGNLVIVPESASSLDLSNSQYNIVFGTSCSIQNNGYVGTGYSSQDIIIAGENVSAVGTNISAFQVMVLLGTNVTVTNANSGASNASSVVAIGDAITLQTTTTALAPFNNFNQVVLIGSNITSTAITYETAGGIFSSNLVHIGCAITCGETSGEGQGSFGEVTIGADITIGDAGEYIVAIGNSITIGEKNGGIVAIGSPIDIPDSASGVIAIGIITIDSGYGGGGVGGIVIGYGGLTNVSNYAMAFGAGVTASDNQCVFGNSSAEFPYQAIEQIIVRSLYGRGNPIDTFAAISNPSTAGDTGLYLVYTPDGTTMQQMKIVGQTISGSLVACLVPAIGP